MRGSSSAAIVAMCGLLLAGCASTTAEEAAANDPFEPMNRVVFGFDEKVDRYVELPIVGFYVFWMPRPLRRGLDNFLENLDMPVVFTNDVLQGEVTCAGQAFGRFTVNSTIGLGGFFDVATRTGLPYRHADFGQTLSVYGVGEGPFLVLPIVGADSPRDLAGEVFDLGIDPITYLPIAEPFYVRASITAGVNIATPLETNGRNVVLRQELQRSSLDPYVTMRSVYRQIRAAQIAGGIPPDEGESGR
ncbi:MAG: VacJ family lipoprotein [Rhizomicrobium sp.]